MGMHDTMARKAAAAGRTAAEFSAAAQKHANATWGLLIIAGGVWYFVSWPWALIPAVLGAYSILKSVSATAIAGRLEVIEGASPVTDNAAQPDGQVNEQDTLSLGDKAQPDMPEGYLSFVRDYGYAMEHNAPPSGGVADTSKLPWPKDTIKSALMTALHEIDDPQTRDQLVIGYLQLSDWQDGVGDTDIGIDDAMALLFLHYSPEVELMAITSVVGNASIDDTTRNALYMKERFGMAAPVHRGAARASGPALGEGYPDFVHGRNGLSLNQAWKDGAEAFKGVAVSGFPNFFLLYGPNTNLGHNSIILMVEHQINYVIQSGIAVSFLYAVVVPYQLLVTLPASFLYQL